MAPSKPRKNSRRDVSNFDIMIEKAVTRLPPARRRGRRVTPTVTAAAELAWDYDY
jgi:hypothetical protein